MNIRGSVCPRPRFVGRFTFLVWFALLVGSCSSAQTPPLVERLSPETVFYVEWRGASSLAAAEQKNHLLELLHDPAVAPLLAGLANQIQKSSPTGRSPMAAMLLPDLVSLLDNAAVFGLAANPDTRKAASAGKPISSFATFLVYDATGKTDLIHKWDALSKVGSQTPIEVTKYDFAGTSVEVRTTSAGSSYSAQAGKYFVASDQRKVIEELITRFSSIGTPASSVAQLPEFSQIRKYIGEDAALELFGRIPDLSQWSPASTANAKSAQQFVKNIHLEKVHVFGAGLNLDGEAAHIGGAVLGDASPGGPFDLAGASGSGFQTLPAIQTGPAFSISRINLPAAYQLLMGAIAGNMTPQQAASMTTMEGAAQAFLGMPIGDALRLFTGEIGSMTLYSDEGKAEQLFVLSIQKPDSVLRVVRALVGTLIVSEDSSGPTTYLDLAYPYMDPQTHQRRRKFYYLAVTPQMLLVAPRKAMLRQAIQRVDARAADPPPAGVFLNPEYAQLRSHLPEKLSGIGAADIAAIPWDKLVASLAAQAAQSAQPSNRQPPDLSWLKLAVISRYLHISVSGWWKDSGGVYFDSYVQ